MFFWNQNCTVKKIDKTPKITAGWIPEGWKAWGQGNWVFNKKSELVKERKAQEGKGELIGKGK